MILIFIDIPKIQEWLQPLDTEHVINQSMKGSCKHSTSNKTKHTYTRTSPIYKFIHVSPFLLWRWNKVQLKHKKD